MNKIESRFTSIFHSLCMGKYFRIRNRNFGNRKLRLQRKSLILSQSQFKLRLRNINRLKNRINSGVRNRNFVALKREIKTLSLLMREFLSLFRLDRLTVSVSL